MEETIYLVKFWDGAETKIIKGFENRQEARQKVKKEAVEYSGKWSKVNEDCWSCEDSRQKVYVEEVELVRDRVDPRRQRRY